MSLKKGDRITAYTDRDRPQDRKEYTLAEDLPERPHSGTTVKVEGEDTCAVWADTVQPALAEWERELLGVNDGPEVPQKGDRVRVIYEGRVTASSAVLGDVSVYTDTGHSILTGRSAKSIEVLERKPFPVGTVAISGSVPHLPAVRNADGWVTGGWWRKLRDDEVRRSPFWTVVHEPPS